MFKSFVRDALTTRDTAVAVPACEASAVYLTAEHALVSFNRKLGRLAAALGGAVEGVRSARLEEKERREALRVANANLQAVKAVRQRGLAARPAAPWRSLRLCCGKVFDFLRRGVCASGRLAGRRCMHKLPSERSFPASATQRPPPHRGVGYLSSANFYFFLTQTPAGSGLCRAPSS